MTTTSTELIISEGVPQHTLKFSPQGLDVLRNAITKDLAQPEFALFVMVCQSTGLNPFAKQIYAVKRGGRMVIQTGIDGFRLIAQRTGQYAGQVGPLWCGADGEWRDVWLSKEHPAAAKVGVLREGFREPVWAVARWDSYAQSFSGKLSDTWASMPDVMIAKCAEALALRRAFPQELSALYADEEMQHLDRGKRGARRPAAVVAEERETVPPVVAKDTELADPPMTDGQRKAIRATLSDMFGDDRLGAHAWVKANVPEAYSDGAIHLSPLTKTTAGEMIDLLNDQKRPWANSDVQGGAEERRSREA